MSLIPSESYSFPDHFTSTVAGSRKQKHIEPEPELIESAPAIVALPDPEPQPKPQPQPTRARVPQPRPQPAPVAIKKNPELARKITPPVPNPALRRASAPPPRVSETPPPVRKMALPPGLKPKMRWNNRAPAINPAPIANNGNGNGESNGNGNGNGNGADHLPYEPLIAPAENVIQMKPQPPVPRPPREIPRPAKAPVPPPPPLRPAPRAAVVPAPAAFTPPQRTIPSPKPTRPAVPREKPRPVMPANLNVQMPQRAAPRPVVAANPQGDFFEDFAQSGETAVSKRRRKAKMRRFLICESIAVSVLLPLAILGLAHRPENLALVWIMNMFTIASAVASALIPILFFALTPTLPQIEE